MRIVVTRVFQAWVKVAGQQISRTKQGILVLIGVTAGDTKQVAQHMALKCLNMRLWSKDNKNWNGSVLDIKGDIMAVSQFTLYSIMKGNKPDFHGAMTAEQAKMLYDHYVETLKSNYSPQHIKTGKFQTLMEVGSINNGPVTIIYEKNINPNEEKQVKELAKINRDTAKQIQKQYGDKKQNQKKQDFKKGQTKKQKQDLQKKQHKQLENLDMKFQGPKIQKLQSQQKMQSAKIEQNDKDNQSQQ